MIPTHEIIGAIYLFVVFGGLALYYCLSSKDSDVE